LKHWEKRKGLEESYKVLAGQISEGLAGYLCVEDWSEGDEPDWRVSLGNLPMGCPNCGRSRLNFHPDIQRIDCEKCDWYVGSAISNDEGRLPDKRDWSGWEMEGVKIDVWADPRDRKIKAQAQYAGTTVVYEGEDFGAEQALAHLLAQMMQRETGDDEAT